MVELTDKNFRKKIRDFKGRIELMKRNPPEVSVKIFFNLSNFGINNYIKTERERFPNKKIKEIIIDMYEFHEKLKSGRKNKWK